MKLKRKKTLSAKSSFLSQKKAEVIDENIESRKEVPPIFNEILNLLKKTAIEAAAVDAVLFTLQNKEIRPHYMKIGKRLFHLYKEKNENDSILENKMKNYCISHNGNDSLRYFLYEHIKEDNIVFWNEVQNKIKLIVKGVVPVPSVVPPEILTRLLDEYLGNHIKGDSELVGFTAGVVDNYLKFLN